MSAAQTSLSTLILGLVMASAFQPAVTHADQSGKTPRIGVLAMEGTPWEEGLRDGLRDLGYVDGRNILIDRRFVSLQTDEEQRFLVTDLARSKVDVIVVFSTPAARAALERTSVPVVFSVGDPIGAGFAESLARPGGNGTGVSSLSTELDAKRLELLRLVVPRARRIGYLTNSANPIAQRQLAMAQKAARELGVQLISMDARDGTQLEAVLGAIPRNAPDAVLVNGDVLFLLNKAKVAHAIYKARLPAMFAYREYHDDGALMSYGIDLKQMAHDMAGYVDKILKGAKPAELPIQQISQYSLAVDLRIARDLNIAIPSEILARADNVIR